MPWIPQKSDATMFESGSYPQGGCRLEPNSAFRYCSSYYTAHGKMKHGAKSTTTGIIMLNLGTGPRSYPKAAPRHPKRHRKRLLRDVKVQRLEPGGFQGLMLGALRLILGALLAQWGYSGYCGAPQCGPQSTRIIQNTTPAGSQRRLPEKLKPLQNIHRHERIACAPHPVEIRFRYCVAKKSPQRSAEEQFSLCSVTGSLQKLLCQP